MPYLFKHLLIYILSLVLFLSCFWFNKSRDTKKQKRNNYLHALYPKIQHWGLTRIVLIPPLYMSPNSLIQYTSSQFMSLSLPRCFPTKILLKAHDCPTLSTCKAVKTLMFKVLVKVSVVLHCNMRLW